MFPELKILNYIIPMYSLCIAIGFLIGMIIVDRISPLFDIKRNDSFKLMCFVEIGVIFGGKLLSIFINFSKVKPYITNFGFFNFILRSGYVYYGGLIGGILLIFLFSEIYNYNFLKCISLVATVTPLIHTIGRIGCFCEGCCYGKIYKGFMAVYIHNEYIFPVQLLEAFLNLTLFVFILVFVIKRKNKTQIGFMYLFLYGIIRIITECFRGDIERGYIFCFSISTWISVICITIGACGYLYLRKNNYGQVVKE